MPSCNTYRLIWVSLTLGVGISSKAQPLLLTLDEGYLLTAAPPDLERGIAALGPPALSEPPLLGCGVALLDPHPDFRHEVAPLRCSCTVAAWRSQMLPLT